MFELMDAHSQSAVIKVIGVGGGGGNAVAHMVEAFEDPGIERVGRFGWKAQVATILTFSADAAQNELGLSNRFLDFDNDPNGINPPEDCSSCHR